MRSVPLLELFLNIRKWLSFVELNMLLSNSQCHPCRLNSCLARASHALSLSFLLTTIEQNHSPDSPPPKHISFIKSFVSLHFLRFVLRLSLSWCFLTSCRSVTRVSLPFITLLLFIVSNYIQAFSITWLPISAGSTFFFRLHFTHRETENLFCTTIYFFTYFSVVSSVASSFGTAGQRD